MTAAISIDRERINQAGALYTPGEAAAFLTLSHRSLERWRRVGSGPRYVKVGRRIAYRLSDLQDWVERQSRRHTHEAVR